MNLANAEDSDFINHTTYMSWLTYSWVFPYSKQMDRTQHSTLLHTFDVGTKLIDRVLIHIAVTQTPLIQTGWVFNENCVSSPYWKVVSTRVDGSSFLRATKQDWFYC